MGGKWQISGSAVRTHQSPGPAATPELFVGHLAAPRLRKGNVPGRNTPKRRHSRGASCAVAASHPASRIS